MVFDKTQLELAAYRVAEGDGKKIAFIKDVMKELDSMSGVKSPTRSETITLVEAEAIPAAPGAPFSLTQAAAAAAAVARKFAK